MARTDTEYTTRAPRSHADFVCDTAGGQLTVHIRGEIDHHTAAKVRQGIDEKLFERRPRRLLLDLAAVSFMDSSGLGLIMGRLSVMRELGGELVVWNPSREVLRIVTLAGMERLVRIEYPPDHIPDHAPDRPIERIPASTADRGVNSSKTRKKRENHREGDRGSTVENRRSTAPPKSANGAKMPTESSKPRSDSSVAPIRRRAGASRAGDALSAALREETTPSASHQGVKDTERNQLQASTISTGEQAPASSRSSSTASASVDRPSKQSSPPYRGMQRKEKDA